MTADGWEEKYIPKYENLKKTSIEAKKVQERVM